MQCTEESMSVNGCSLYLDDVYVVARPDRPAAVHSIFQPELWRQRSEFCDVLEQVPRASDLSAVVWRRSELPSELQGIKVIDTPLGHLDCVTRHLRPVTREHQLLLGPTPFVAGTQAACRFCCVVLQSTYQLLSVRPEAVAEYAPGHDREFWHCLGNILRIDLDQCDPVACDSATVPLSLGLCSAVLTRVSIIGAVEPTVRR